MIRTYGKIWHERDRWIIDAQPDVAIRVKRIFPRVMPTNIGTIAVEDTQEVSRDIEWLLQRWDMEMSDEDLSRLKSGADSHRQRGDRVEAILSGVAEHHDLPLVPEPEMKPREYQHTAHDLARTTGALLLADELGLGKTLSATMALSDPAMRPMLVVTLTGLPKQWIRELKKTFPDLHAHEVKKVKPYDMAKKDGREPDMIVMNYAKLAGWGDHLRGKVNSVVFDEVQELRREGSQKHAAAATVASSADLVMGLSATPVYNYGGEMYSILSILAPHIVGARDEFAREWCKSTYGLDPKTRIADPPAFRQWMTDQGIFLRRTRTDVGIQLPPASLVEQFVDYDEQEWKKASGDAMEIARLLMDQNATHQQRWTATGQLDWRLRQATGIAKAPFVADFARLVLESEEKIILAGWHRPCWDIWCERLADFNPVLYTGTESPVAKRRSFEAFTDGDSRIMMLSLRSGAGLDGLQDASNTIVFGELDWAPGVHRQVVGRLHRPGQVNPVFAYFCISNEGSDPLMADVLNVKKMEADMLIDPEVKPGAEPIIDPSAQIKALAEKVLAGSH